VFAADLVWKEITAGWLRTNQPNRHPQPFPPCPKLNTCLQLRMAGSSCSRIRQHPALTLPIAGPPLPWSGVPPPPPTSLPHAPSTTTARPAGFPLGPTRLRRTPTSNPDRAEGPAELGKKLQSENCHTDLLVKNSGAGRGPTPKYTGKMEQSDSANDILRCTIMLQVLVGPASHTFVIHRCRTAAYELFHWFY
jgi:hypothetical protein